MSLDGIAAIVELIGGLCDLVSEARRPSSWLHRYRGQIRFVLILLMIPLAVIVPLLLLTWWHG